MSVRHAFPLVLLFAALAVPAARTQAVDAASEADLRHQSVDWLAIQSHLPDTKTGSPAALQTAGDVLRARRFPEDALVYYHAALDRGGSAMLLMNRIGVTELELRRPAAAVVAFRHIIATDKRNAEAWNNLGASAYMMGDFKSALSDYRRAVKLDKSIAVFHSNLGTALFDRQDYEASRVEFATAIRLDPQIFQHSDLAGVQAHVLSSSDRGRFCFEMAQLSAETGNDAAVLQWLSRATEAGFDVKGELGQSRELAPYRHDVRVALILANAKTLRTHELAAAPAPPLPADAPLRD